MPGAENGRTIVGPMSLEDLQQDGDLVSVSGTPCVSARMGGLGTSHFPHGAGLPVSD
jgi:hypothetical protein